MGVRGGCDATPGANARRFASVVCASVLAGELSLLAALAQGVLVRSHEQLNRYVVASGNFLQPYRYRLRFAIKKYFHIG